MIKHTILNKRREEIEVNLSPLKAIRLNCLDCAGFSSDEVKKCVIPNCSLYPFRFGKNPGIKRIMSAEQKEKARMRMKEYQKNRKQSKSNDSRDTEENLKQVCHR